MTRFKFKDDLKRSFYDDEIDTVFVRTSYKDHAELEGILNHEVSHVILAKTATRFGRLHNIFWEYHKAVFYWIFIAFIVYIFFYSDLHACYKYVKDWTRLVDIHGLNKDNITVPKFNFTNEKEAPILNVSDFPIP